MINNRENKPIPEGSTRLSYYQIFQYAKDNSIETAKHILESAPQENAKANLDTLKSYLRIYCRSDNDSLNHVALEAYEWGRDYMVKGFQVGLEFSKHCGPRSCGEILVAIVGSVCVATFGGLAGGVIGCIAGGLMHSMRNRMVCCLMMNKKKLSHL